MASLHALYRKRPASSLTCERTENRNWTGMGVDSLSSSTEGDPDDMLDTNTTSTTPDRDSSDSSTSGRKLQRITLEHLSVRSQASLSASSYGSLSDPSCFPASSYGQLPLPFALPPWLGYQFQPPPMPLIPQYAWTFGYAPHLYPYSNLVSCPSSKGNSQIYQEPSILPPTFSALASQPDQPQRISSSNPLGLKKPERVSLTVKNELSPQQIPMPASSTYSQHFSTWKTGKAIRTDQDSLQESADARRQLLAATKEKNAAIFYGPNYQSMTACLFSGFSTSTDAWMSQPKPQAVLTDPRIYRVESFNEATFPVNFKNGFLTLLHVPMTGEDETGKYLDSSTPFTSPNSPFNTADKSFIPHLMVDAQGRRQHLLTRTFFQAFLHTSKKVDTKLYGKGDVSFTLSGTKSKQPLVPLKFMVDADGRVQFVIYKNLVQRFGEHTGKNLKMFTVTRPIYLDLSVHGQYDVHVLNFIVEE